MKSSYIGEEMIIVQYILTYTSAGAFGDFETI